MTSCLCHITLEYIATKGAHLKHLLHSLYAILYSTASMKMTSALPYTLPRSIAFAMFDAGL